ncbi:hypothetical protein BT96DRAFT_919390 [Gymnopus androsaceus JB14]|uniref:Uncharacterized protein n=1 Tax=Gymnopus androsaceus JB14 TaxID=1447944 RepID=A0A6A4HR17_9AGAR|nr:hypothetical protein BT96DRAFT_919390 [Gymnopus androsaceus JB14]
MSSMHPTQHPLQPHQISLVAIFILAFKDSHIKKFDPMFLLYLQRMLLDEVSEVAQPKSALELQNKLSAAPNIDEGDARDLIMAFNAFNLETTDHLINFFSGLPVLYQERDEGPEPIFGRRSIFGFYCRRCYVAFAKLSFSGVIQLLKDFRLWSAGQPNSGYRATYKDELNNTDNHVFKTHGDRQNWAQPDAYASWIKGQTIGDETLTKENLRSFFEQRFHEGNDSGVRQLALLNMVRHHYIHQEYSAGRKLLSEAISVSRTSGDKITLQQCISLLRRFPSVDALQKPPINEIQPKLNPLDILYDIRKLMNEANEQPLSASFIKIAEALGVFDHWCDRKISTVKESDQWAQHAVQANVWNAAGCEGIGDLAADIVISFTVAGSGDNNRLTVLLNSAYRRARQGNYDNALAILLDPDVWRGLTFSDYKLWAQEVWHVLAMRATRRGQDRLYREFLLPRQPSGERHPRHYVYIAQPVPTGKISDSLAEVLRMRDCETSGITTEQLLRSLWHSEFLFRMHYYRTAVILLADAGIEFGQSRRSRKMIEDMMPQMITGNDIEQRAFAAFTIARCILIAEQSATPALQEAMWWLAIAEADYLKLQIYRSAMDVQYLLAVVHNSMGAEQERDAAAERFEATQQIAQRLEMDIVDDEVGAIMDIVSRVGVLEL